jgi:hypothetical protein
VSDTAVLVIDMLNAYQHEDAELLIPNVADIIDPLARLVSVAQHERRNRDCRRLYGIIYPSQLTTLNTTALAIGTHRQRGWAGCATIVVSASPSTLA